MEILALPPAKLKLSKKEESIFVWCVIRKKTLLLTPEEWVRQHVIHYLINHLNFPVGLMASEFSIKVNQLKKRCDVVVFNKAKKPILIIECKAPQIGLDEKVFLQIAHYNFKLNVDYIMLTNGLHHVICKIDRINNQLLYLEKLPTFENLTNEKIS